MGPVAPKKKTSFAPGVFVAVVPFMVGSGTSSQGNVAHAVFQVRKVIFWGNMGKQTPIIDCFIMFYMDVGSRVGIISCLCPRER